MGGQDAIGEPSNVSGAVADHSEEKLFTEGATQALATWGSVDTPQGGMKESGIGRRNGPEGIVRFTEPQSVTVQRAPLLHPPVGVTQQQFADIMARTFKALHLTGRR
jgi:hypothetical protein